MGTYTELWNSTEQLHTIRPYVPLIVGIIFTILLNTEPLLKKVRTGFFNALYRRLTNRTEHTLATKDILRPLAVGLIFVGLLSVSAFYLEKQRVAVLLKNPTFEMVEGTVKIESTEKKKDRIMLSGKTFIIKHSPQSIFYSRPNNRGGVLTPGKTVRITYIPSEKEEKKRFGEGKIICIEQQGKS